VPSQDYVVQDNKRCYDKIVSDWNFRLPSLGFKCILVGLMNMIDGMQFWTPILFYRHKTVLVSPWLYCIDKWHAKSLQGCPGLNIFKWVVAGGIFHKDEVEQQLMYFKNKVFTITDTMYRYCTKEDDGLTEGAYCSCTAGFEIYACFFLFSISCLCSAIQDH
jgi:hypothetical protein